MLDISGIKRLQFDVLVIGAGGAGLSAAIAASQEEGIRVGLVCKSLLGKAFIFLNFLHPNHPRNIQLISKIGSNK